MQVGAAQLEITPEQPFQMGGTFQCFAPEKKLDPLMAGAVVIDDDQRRLAIISCDLGTLEPETIVEIKKKIKQKTGILPHRFFPPVQMIRTTKNFRSACTTKWFPN